jgi:aminoglycoside phosphotransferase (APT) family kinase protein
MPEGGSTAGLELIGEGREAEIFAWDDGTVLRLLRSGIDPARVQGEAAAMRAAAAGGVAAPRVRDTITVDGRAGLVMDRVDGPDLITLMGRRPWTIPRAARIVGTAQARMHEVVAPPDLDDLRSHARFKIEATAGLPPELAELALATLDTLPDGDRLCHGDVHPGNVLLGSRGPAVIDWTNATRGDPAGDVARTRLMLQLGAVQEYMPALIRLVVRHMQTLGRGGFFRLYVRAYARARPVDAELVARWEIVRAADRMFEGIEPERRALLELLERRANELA